MMRPTMIVLAALVALVFPAAASATEINFTNAHFNVDMENLEVGQYGAITYEHPDYLSTRTWGNLPGHSRLVFTYSFVAPIADDSGNQMNAYYDYLQGADHYYGSAYSDRFAPPLLEYNGQGAEGYRNDIASLPLVFATSNLVGGNTALQWSVTNLSSGFAVFENILNLGTSDGINLLTYQVSSVPLPAALPLFAGLIAAMFGLRRIRRAR